MSKGIKIYTKGGDQGETALLGGTRVLKNHERVEASGNLDELNAFIGMVRDYDIDPHYQEFLIWIQKKNFIAETLISQDPEKEIQKLPSIKEEDILLIEHEIDAMNETLPPLNHFILPGGHPAVSACHICRTVCRRAERSVVGLRNIRSTDDIIIRYLNRLSDYLFVLARKLANDLGVKETPWKT
ncbi:MAG: cob(I)yrinic acid a,c-diamide adenosyltransferase [Bacteroidales bacterium]|nr:cob(I)yrinic acid a,c-diamide adenosyltransferase [Bacteroidales bacterium]MDD4602198.1 cob(I)yrinic acid a,c-diamide adenosyltransferase [Bacteroidales bacterium]